MADRTYKARFSRRDDGGYDASFGRQSRKIEAVIQRNETGQWHLASGPGPKITPTSILRDVKEPWAAWAAAKYAAGDDTEVAARVTRPTPPPPPARKPPAGGPPPFVPKAKREEMTHLGQWGIWCLSPGTSGKCAGWVRDDTSICLFDTKADAKRVMLEMGATPDRYEVRPVKPADVQALRPDLDSPFLCDVFHPAMVDTHGQLTPIGALCEVEEWMVRTLSPEDRTEQPWANVSLTLRRRQIPEPEETTNED